MNRRGFLAMLAGLAAEPLVPKGTAFSFLGGIYRPAWEEVQTPWPIPEIRLLAGQKLIIEGERGVELICGPLHSDEGVIELSRSPFAPGHAAAVMQGLSPMMNDPHLFKSRDGNYRIRDAKPSQLPRRKEFLDITVTNPLSEPRTWWTQIEGEPGWIALEGRA